MRLVLDRARASSRSAADLLPAVRVVWERALAEWRAHCPHHPVPELTATFRASAEQAKLYAQGRTTPGRVVTNAKPGQSLHNYYPAPCFDVAFRDGAGRLLWDDEIFLPLARQLRALMPELEWGANVAHGGDWHGSLNDAPHFQARGFTWEDAAAGRMPQLSELPTGAHDGAGAGGSSGPVAVDGARDGGRIVRAQRVVSAGGVDGAARGEANGGGASSVGGGVALSARGPASDTDNNRAGVLGTALVSGEGRSMRKTFKAWFLAFAPRLVGAAVGYGAAIAASKAGITVSPEAQAAAVTAGYGFAHTIADHIFGTNPQ